MKKVILFTLFCLAFSVPYFCKAQAVDKHMTGDKGKTYYDDAKTKPKEIYNTNEVTVADPDDPQHPMIYLQKEGPYFYYYENGKLKISGWYSTNQKNGTWKYYDEKGTLTKTEKWVNDKLVQ